MWARWVRFGEFDTQRCFSDNVKAFLALCEERGKLCVRVKDGRDRIEDTEKERDLVPKSRSLAPEEKEKGKRIVSAGANAESLDTAHTASILGASDDPCSSPWYKPDREQTRK